MATAYSVVEALDAATVMVTARATVRATDACKVRALSSALVTVSGQARVWAWGRAAVTGLDASQIEAWGSATVMATGSGTVEARENAFVAAGGSVHVRAFGAAMVRARGRAQIEATDGVSITRHSMGVEVSGGRVTDVARFATPEEWCEYYGIEVHNGVATLYKAVDQDFNSYHGTSYLPGTGAVRPDWDGGERECGGGLHFSPRPTSRFRARATRCASSPAPDAAGGHGGASAGRLSRPNRGKSAGGVRTRLRGPRGRHSGRLGPDCGPRRDQRRSQSSAARVTK